MYFVLMDVAYTDIAYGRLYGRRLYGRRLWSFPEFPVFWPEFTLIPEFTDDFR